MQPSEIKELIQKGLQSEVIIEGDGTHFTAIVISHDFIGKSRIAKQQLVYATLQSELLSGKLHALSLKTFTPEEWQVFNQKGS